MAAKKGAKPNPFAKGKKGAMGAKPKAMPFGKKGAVPMKKGAK